MKSTIHHEYVSIGNQSATHRIILLHGWGADAEDLLPLAGQITEGSELDFQIISLRAPNFNPENNFRQWYGLFPARWDEAKKEVAKLTQTLKGLSENSISLEKTVLFGFSQGAAMSIDAGIKLNFGLIIACSGYLHPKWRPPERIPNILLSHGLKDEVVPSIRSREIYNKLQMISPKNCELIEFNGNHEIDKSVINIIKNKIRFVF